MSPYLIVVRYREWTLRKMSRWHWKDQRIFFYTACLGNMKTQDYCHFLNTFFKDSIDLTGTCWIKRIFLCSCLVIRYDALWLNIVVGLLALKNYFSCHVYVNDEAMSLIWILPDRHNVCLTDEVSNWTTYLVWSEWHKTQFQLLINGWGYKTNPTN